MPKLKSAAVVLPELRTRANPRREPSPMKRLRVARNLSQTDLAMQLGVCTSAVSTIECYPSRLTPPVAERVAKVLGVKVADLFPKGHKP